jgi:hypothetical protein
MDDLTAGRNLHQTASSTAALTWWATWRCVRTAGNEKAAGCSSSSGPMAVLRSHYMRQSLDSLPILELGYATATVEARPHRRTRTFRNIPIPPPTTITVNQGCASRLRASTALPPPTHLTPVILHRPHAAV